MTATECESDFKLTTDTPYLALTGELWGVYYENFEEKWPPYTILYLLIYCIFVTDTGMEIDMKGGCKMILQKL